MLFSYMAKYFVKFSSCISYKKNKKIKNHFCQLVCVIDHDEDNICFLADDHLPIRPDQEHSLYLSEWLLPSLGFRDKFVVKDVRKSTSF